ncbi:MAG: HDOD domain-containing protein [Fuerstiella sp.]
MKTVNAIPPLPPSVVQLNNLFTDPFYEFKDVVRAVELDPSLSGKLLHLANCASRGTRSTGSLSDAVFRLGVLESIAAAEEPLHHVQTPCIYNMFKSGIPSSRRIVVQGLGAGGAFGNFRNHLYYRDTPLGYVLRSPVLGLLLRLTANCTGRGTHLLTKAQALRNTFPLEDHRNPIWQWHQHGDLEWVCNHFQVRPMDVIARQVMTMRKVEAQSLCHIWAAYSLLGDEDITLTLWSKLAHAQSRHLSSPLYGDGVLEYAFSIPWAIKLHRPENRIRKAIARKADVPEVIVKRRKTGFGIKRRDWATDRSVFGPLVPLAEKVVCPDLINGLRTSRPADAMLFWNMINYALWKRLCIDGESLGVLQDELAAAEIAHRE